MEDRLIQNESVFIVDPSNNPVEDFAEGIEPTAGYSYFKDNQRRIDFIVEYVDGDEEDNSDKTTTRNTFFANLEKKGIQFETAYLFPKNKYGTFDEEKEREKVVFVKLHAPFSVLCTYAQKNKLKFPIGHNDITISDQWRIGSLVKWLTKMDPFVITHPQFKEPVSYFVEEFKVENLSQYIHALRYHGDTVTVDEDAFFTPTQRSRLVEFVLDRTLYSEDETQFGYKPLKYHKIITDAYPLHEGDLILDKSKQKKAENFRQKLQIDWASPGRVFKYQPILAIKKYFGEKIALYFAWLGFYTSFLVPAAIVGLLCFIYGITTISSDIPTKDKCSSPAGPNGTLLFYMCPLCPMICPYTLLKTSCMYAKLTRAFDNEATIFFAIFMALWATLFLEFWKRKQVTLAYEWHTFGFEEAGEQLRPEYKLRADAVCINQVTKKEELCMSSLKQHIRFVGSYSVVAFFFVIVISALLAVIIFRAALIAVISQQQNPIIRAKSSIIVSATAACLNLISINILKFFYGKIANRLTDWENPRTRTDYEDSYTMKMFWFQFINTYASIIYVAFLKSGDINGTPDRKKKFAGRFFLEECTAEGCFLSLTIQLVIIMVGQQIIGNVKEIMIPFIKQQWATCNAKKKPTFTTSYEEETSETLPQWVSDHFCEGNEQHSLFEQYLEIVLQYGFVTMFVAAFPLAPFFALLNNIIEIRLDAFNCLKFYRRPVAKRTEDIGAWYGILATLTTLSTIVSAFLLAFTSNAIPRITYQHYFSPDGTMNGFVDFSLSSFNVRDFPADYKPHNSTIFDSGLPPQPTCRYGGYFEPRTPYHRSKAFWVILAARLGFVICFQALVLTVTWIVAYIIPDIPESVTLKLRREQYLAENKDKEKQS